MPSGSRAGSSGRSGGGSHFGGGSRGSSGGSRGGSHFGSIGPRMFRGRPGMMHGRNVFFIGTRYYMPATAMNKISSMIMGLFMILFFSIFPFAFLLGYSSNLKVIESDYIYYQDMIADAEANPEELQVEGRITAIKKLEHIDKWYILYEFTADDGDTVDGYTFSIYTWEQVKEFQRGGKILLAVESLETDRNSDSVNIDFKDFELEDDGEYVYAKKMKTIAIVVYSLFIAGFVALLVATIITFKKQLQEKEAEEAEKKEREAEENSIKHCAYCGSVINETRETCAKCGAANIHYKK